MTYIIHRTPEPIREPVSIGIGVIELLGVAGVIGFESAALIGTITIAAAAVGANYALNRVLTPRLNRPDTGGNIAGINSPEARGSIRQSAPEQKFIYGSPKIGGAVCFSDDSKPPYLYLQFLHSARRISSYKLASLGVNDIPFPPFLHNAIVTPIDVDGQHYISDSGAVRLRACFRDGRDDQAIDALLAASFPNLETTFRQRGIAASTWEFKWGDDQDDFDKLWGRVSIPSPEVIVDGAPVYDPRDPAQRYPEDWSDPDDVADATATWQFRRNAALIQADWAGHPDGVNMRPDQIRWDEIADAANFDDEIVEEDLPRHTIDGVVTLGENPNIAMEAMLTANRGFFVQSRGRGWVRSSRPLLPRVTITDSMLTGGFEFNEDRPKRDKLNTVRSRFSASGRKFQEIDGPEHIDDEALGEDGEILATTIRLPFTSDDRTVQRLTQQYQRESRLKKSIVIQTNMRAFGLDAGDCVLVDLDILPAANGTYTVEEISVLGDYSGVSISLNEYDAELPVAPVDLQPFTLPELDVS